MQTPTIMLDPMIGKIITAERQVEQSVGINPQDKQPIDVSDETENASTPAEVRLVVKFIVEEHTIYKGKIRKVKQLESEELSRIVSHIAWDGAKESDKASSVGETEDETPGKTTPEILEEQSQTSCSKTDESNPNEQSSNLPPNVDDVTDDISCAEIDDLREEFRNHTREELQVQERPASNNQSSDHEAYIKSSTNLEELSCKEEILVAQNVTTTKIDELDVVIDCDKTREQSSNFCETEKVSLEKQQDLSTEAVDQENLAQVLVNNTSDQSYNRPKSNSNNILELVDDDNNSESQLITETLNDCVAGVDLESKQHEIDSTSSNCNSTSSHIEESKTTKVELEEFSKTILNHVDDLKHLKEESFAKGELLVKQEVTTNPGDSLQTSSTLNLALNLECSHEKIVQSNNEAIVSQTNLTQPNVPPISSPAPQTIKDATSSVVKRKAPSDQNHSAGGKRIRRASSHKEQRNLNTRKSKTLENASAKQNLPFDSTATNTSSSPVNQPLRQNKVFAKWSDNHFYPGYILKQAKDRKFVISFLDGAQKDVAETDLIPLCNIEGKQVRVTIAKNYCYNAIVHDQRSPVNDQPMFDVEYQSNGPVRKCVSWKDIFLTAEQGTPLINQADKNSGASNFADVDLDNIIYEKRSRRIQDMEEFYFTGSSPHRTKTSLLL